jgi:hypothetical protein
MSLLFKTFPGIFLFLAVACEKQNDGSREIEKIRPGTYYVLTHDSVSVTFELKGNGTGKKELWSKEGTCSFIEGQFNWDQYKDILLITDVYDSIRIDFCNEKWEKSAVVEWTAYKVSKINTKGFLAVSSGEREYLEFKRK